MPSVNGQLRGKDYWRSLDDFVDSPAFQTFIENEFPSQLENVITPHNRRSFLKLMGASLALAGAGLQGCRRWPDEKIAPFAHRPEGYVPGEAAMYASACELGGVASGVLVKSVDGRPVKIEGNGKHPITRGSSDQYTQAEVLNFYDPDRSRQPLQIDGDSVRPTTMATFREEAAAHFAAARGRRGQGVAILSQSTSSESWADMKRRAKTAMPLARWFEYESINRDNEIAGSHLAFGDRRRAQYDCAKADVIVCLDSDFLVSHPAAAKHAREFAERRRAVDRTMPRLIAAEGTVSLTGATADHRIRMRSRDVARFAILIAQKLAAHDVAVLGVRDVMLPMDDHGDLEKWADAIADDLSHARGRSIVVAGPRQPASVHALTHAINFALGNAGETIHFTQEPHGAEGASVDSIRALVNDMTAGRVETLVILGGNPVFDAPTDSGFAEALDSVPTRIHIGLHENETARACTWHVPQAHWLESWGDARAWDGTLSIQQPLILPLYDGMSFIEVLAMVSGDELVSGYDIVRRWFRERRGSDAFEHAWRSMLLEGLLAESAWAHEDVQLDPSALSLQLGRTLAASSGPATFEVIFAQDHSVYDGRFANNGWLQELPDPVAKICWDNAAFMSPMTAERLGVGAHDQIYLEVRDPNAREPQVEDTRRQTLAVHVVPGHADDSITVNVGYGRRAGGHVAENVGFDVNRLRFSAAMDFTSAADVDAAPDEGSYVLATTQDHHAMDTPITEKGKQTRLPKLVREASLEEYLAHGRESLMGHQHHPPIISLWEMHKYEPQYLEDGRPNPDWAPNKWAMVTDLNACTGCSACVIACQAENNIPIVGKRQVMEGREMHWIRVDRYFKGADINEPGVIFQPVACQHCETAPCEQVCPVAATTHDRDGLNVMVYNRCVGTRYCSNNCPYKVRRFNFYDWHVSDPKEESLLKPPVLDIPDAAHDKAFAGKNEVKRMLMNPDVTVRMRGVMEKCSFCIQRINKAKIAAKNAWVKANPDERPPRSYAIQDGSFTTACAQACPTEAIVFGDLHDEDSRVHRLWEDARHYELLEEINTKPRNRYLAKIRNTSNALPTPELFESGGHGGKSESGEAH